ncbi:hypothetical protein [Streptomyces sp. AC495_CC817]|uniref:hypothetical protein n=1 Tax=Streptomyces sp. AC495_CC817 TaxID=2823900 RepID=UPI001C26E1AC|nr:hypothetical protein [Streptomyces sp. AC495_CC817]
MANPGANPIDASTPVGVLRLTVGDTESQPLEPPVSGLADYAVWSDDALSVALMNAAGNNLRAAGNLYRQLAAVYAQTGRSIKTDDLQLNTLSRGDSLLKVAQSFLDEAQANENATANDFFQIVPFAGRAGRQRCVRPEGTPMPLTCCGACS